MPSPSPLPTQKKMNVEISNQIGSLSILDESSSGCKGNGSLNIKDLKFVNSTRKT